MPSEDSTQDRRRGAALLVSVALLATSCGSSGSKDTKSTAASGTTKTTLKSSNRPFTRATTTTQPAGTNTATAEELDLGDAPSFVIDSYASLVHVNSGATKAILNHDDAEAQRGVLSPDGKFYAITRRSDAVQFAGLDLVATDSGERVQSFEIDTTTVTLSSWSPDSSAVLVEQRKQGASPLEANKLSVYRIDGSVQNVDRMYGPSNADIKWTIGSDGATWSVCGALRSLCYGYQLVTSKHEPVYLAYQQDTRVFGRFDADKKALVPLVGLGAQTTRLTPCGRYALLWADRPFGVYDSDTDEIVAVPDNVKDCPVVAADGTKMAFATPEGPISVDTETAKVSKVAREGKPVIFSKNATQIVISAPSGTFRVATDGSGGKKASVPLYGGCAITVLGKMLANNGVLYDVETDSATKISFSRQQRTCAITDDGKWVYSAGRIYDVESARAGYVTLTIGGKSKRVSDSDKFAWRVPWSSFVITSS